MLFEDRFGGRAEIEVVIHLGRFNAISAGGREVEAISSGPGMVLAVSGGGDQERVETRQRLAAPIELRVGNGSQAVESHAGGRFALPGHDLALGFGLRHVGHQSAAVRAVHCDQYAALPKRYVEAPRANVHRVRSVIHSQGRRLGLLFRRRRRQRTLERTTKMKSAGADPHQFGAAPIEPHLDAVPVRGERHQRRHNRQRLRGHQSKTISRCISPVTTAWFSPTYMLISLRTPKSSR